MVTALERLKAQQAKLQARIQLMEARHKTSERKKDTRRKILIGAYYWEQAKEHHMQEDIKKIMDSYLTRNSDRQLFDLPILAESQENSVK
jgi:hypothetical protein